MKVARTLGPFIDGLGISHFVDLIPVPVKVPIIGASGALGLLVLDGLPLPPPGPLPLPQPPPQRIAIGAGTVGRSRRRPPRRRHRVCRLGLQRG
jgi:hypothetical protein